MAAVEAEIVITILIYHCILLAQLYIVCRNKTASLKELVQVFLVGATGSVLANFLVQGIAVRFIGSDTVFYTLGPISEEVIKIAFVFFLLFFTKMGSSISIEDGILLGAAAGAGYGFAEDSVRAIGLGLSRMSELFPAYTWTGLPGVFTHWLITERGVNLSNGQGIIAGHLMWTALVGAGLGFARKMSSKLGKNMLLPLGLLVWVTLDHAIDNFGPYDLSPFLKNVYAFYGRGWGIWIVLTLAVIGAVIVDELLLRRHGSRDEKLLLPGEKQRSLIQECWLVCTGWRFGKKYWGALLNFLMVRRQLGYMTHAGEKTDELIALLQKRRLYVIAAASLSGKYKNTGIPAGIAALWYGPRPNFFKFSLHQKFWWFFAVLLMVIGVFNAWLFLFSVYMPRSLASMIFRSPLLPILGVIGYGMAFFEVVVYYKKKLWRTAELEVDNRVKTYSHSILINTSGITVIFSLPFFIGVHPLLVDKFLWGQLSRFFEFLKESRKWVGGTVSAGIGAIPIVGNVQSGANAAFGYDYIADEPVEGFDRFMAVLGAVPLAGNALRSGWMVAKAAKYAKVGKAVNKLKKPVEALEEFGDKFGEVMEKVEKVQTAKDYLTESYGKVRDQLQDLSQPQARQLFEKRDTMLKEWSHQRGLTKVDEGHYQMPYDGNNVDVFSGKVGTAKLKLRHDLPDTGQISIDHKNQSVMVDTIGGQPGEIKAQIADLQKQFPEHTVLHRSTKADGFTVTDVVAPDGTRSTFYSVPTHARGSVSSVSSR